MSGGILQLVTTGVETLYITGNPDITMFKMVYRRHTNFSLNDVLHKISGIRHFGDSARFKLSRIGDCIHKLWLVFDIPEVTPAFDTPTLKLIAALLAEYGITWDYVGDGFTASELITSEIYDDHIKELIYDRISDLVYIYKTSNDHLFDVDAEYTSKVASIAADKLTISSRSSAIASKIQLELNPRLTTLLASAGGITPTPSDLIEYLTIIKNIFYFNGVDYVQYIISAGISPPTIRDISITLSDVVNFSDQFPHYITEVMTNIKLMVDAITTDVLTTPTSSAGIEADLVNIEQYYSDLSDVAIYLLDIMLRVYEILIEDKTKQREAAVMEEYISEITPLLIQNVTASTTNEKLRLLYEGIIAYRSDVMNYTTDFNNNVYNFIGIKKQMYNRYIIGIIKTFDSDAEYTYDSDVFSPDTTLRSDPTYTDLYNNIIFYHVIQFGRYVVTHDLVDMPLEQYFHTIIEDGFAKINGPTEYTEFGFSGLDSYRMYQLYIENIDDILEKLTSTNDLIALKNNLLDNMLWNIRSNYVQMINVLRFLNNASFENPLHYRFGYYKSYTLIDSVKVENTSTFSSLFGSTDPLLYDNVTSHLTVEQLPGQPLVGITQYFPNTVRTQIKGTEELMQNKLELQVYSDFYSDYNLWERVVLSGTLMTRILTQANGLYNQSVDFYARVTSLLNSNVRSRVVIMNFIPIGVVRDLPTMLYDVLNTTIINLANGGTNTAEELTGFAKTMLDYRDRDQRGGIATLVDTFKKSIYSDVIEQVMFYNDGGTYNIIDADYINTVGTTYAPNSTNYLLMTLFRPEQTYGMDITPESDITQNVMLPIQAIIERFRTEWADIIDSFRTTYSVDVTSITNLEDAVNSVLDAFKKRTLPSYKGYANNGYSLYNIESASTVSSVTSINYCDVISSIWYSINKQMVRAYNSLFNNYLLSYTYYELTLGATMKENYDKFAEIVADAASTPFEPGYQLFTFDYDLFYNNIIYTADDAPMLQGDIGYEFYLTRPFADIFTDTITRVEHMITHFDKVYLMYTSYKNILNILGITLAAPLKYYMYSTSSASTTLLRDLTYDLAEDTINPSYAREIMDNSATYVATNYKGVLDVISGTYTPLAEKSIAQMIQLGMTNVNPYTLSKEITTSMTVNELYYMNNWWSTNRSSYIPYFTTGADSLYTLLSQIIAPMTSEKLFADSKTTEQFNNFSTRYDVINYVLNNIISQMPLSFILTAKTQKEFRLTYSQITKYLVNLVEETDRIIKYLGVVEDTDIITGYRYPIYVFDNPTTEGDDEDGPFNITYTDSPIDKKINKYIVNATPDHAWAKELGHRLIQYTDIEVDGVVYDQYTSDLLHLDHELNINENHERGYNKLIGNEKDMYTIDGNIKTGRRIYVPLNYWFCKDISLSIPMTNILYSDIYINITTRPLDELFYRETGSYITKRPKLTSHILIQYIYLEEGERQKIAKSKLEFLIERYKYGGVQLKYSKDINSSNEIDNRLYMTDPCKYLLWTHKIHPNIQLTANSPSIVDWFYYGYRTIDSDNRFTNKFKSVNKIKIKFSGRDRESYKHEIFYNAVQPISKYTGSLSFGEYFYSFALLPLLYQPSGSASLTHIPELSVVHQYTTDIIETITEDELIIRTEYWEKSYQVIRIMSGIMAPAFIY